MSLQAATPRRIAGVSRLLPVHVLLVVLLIATTGCAATATPLHSPPRALPTATGSATTAPATHLRAPVGASLVAVAARSVVTAVSPDRSMQWGLMNPNGNGAPLVLLVVSERSDGYLVRIPARPNGATGWVSADEVRVAVDPYSLQVSLRLHRLVVYHLGRPVRRYVVGVGSRNSPTPTGSYFLTELLRAPDPTGPYGPLAFGLSAYSDVYTEFEGGVGQIGLHGTNDPTSIGRNVSHGCLRLPIADITALARLVPVGTPITISR